MCIYTLKNKNKKKIKNSSRGVRYSTERPKIRCPGSGVKDIAKTNKD